MDFKNHISYNQYQILLNILHIQNYHDLKNYFQANKHYILVIMFQMVMYNVDLNIILSQYHYDIIFNLYLIHNLLNIINKLLLMNNTHKNQLIMVLIYIYLH